MIDPDKRPPLSVTVQEQIESEQKAIHDKYWPQILEFNVPVNFFAGISGDRSSPPIRQQRKLFRILASYATALYDAEAKRYPPHKEQWLLTLGQEVFNTVTARLRFADLNYHASDNEIKVAIMEAIRIRTNAYLDSVLGLIPLEPLPASTKETAPPRVRLSATVSSPLAARRMETYLREKGIGQTEFAIQAQTTDRTLRNFRKTGKVRRDILASIASAMGTTKEKLLKD